LRKVRMPAEGERKFIADAALGRLARYLRMLGYDTVYLRDEDGAAAVRAALRTGRTLLTRRRDFAGRKDMDVFVVEADDVLSQLAAAAERFGLRFTADAMSRCLECNQLLVPAKKEEVRDRLPPHVRQTQETFAVCPDCARVYWPGTHYARAVARLLATLRTRREGAA
jgi:uncharacterized protein with PIN domain